MRIASSVLKWKGSESWKADRILSHYATRFHLNPFLNPTKLAHISIKPVPDFVHGVFQLWHHHHHPPAPRHASSSHVLSYFTK
jgi:hypothetical protein